MFNIKRIKGLECSVNPCQNKGECSQDLDGNLRCTCEPGFNGTWCESATAIVSTSKLQSKELNPCQGVTCSNHGNCHAKNQNEYLCLCNGNSTLLKLVVRSHYFLICSSFRGLFWQ